MRKFVYLYVLIAALFTTLATNNTAKAQPASFTQDFLQEDYRDLHDGNGEQLVRTNTVTVVWDAVNSKLTFKNFYWRYECVPNTIMDLVIDGLNNTSITWQSDTKGTFSWRTQFLGNNVLFSWTYWSYAVVSHMTYTNIPVRSVDPVTRKEGKSYYKYDGGSACTGTIDLEKGEITFDNPWGMVIGHGSSWTTINNTAVVEYFNRSKMTIIKTDLVDIVNDGEVGEEYEVYDDLVGVTTVDGVLSAPMGVSRNQNTFMIEKGRYKLDLDLGTNALTVSQSAEDITGFVNNGSYPTYYVLGQANDNDWNPTVGQPMATTDGVHYSAVVNFDGRDDNKNYFSLTSDLANNNDEGGWNYVDGSCRLGPSYNNYPVAMGAVLFAKDFGKYKYPSEISDGQIDFLGQVAAEYAGYTKLQPVANFDQSNWVMLTGVSDPDNYVGKIITGKSITGTLVDKANPTIAVTSNPTAGEASRYEPNIYIMPSFNEAYYAPDSRFFFVAPKVQEYAFITWACFNGIDNNFYAPAENNSSQLDGGIKVSWDYYPAGEPQPGYVYQFDAIVRKVASEPSGASQLKAETGTPIVNGLNANYMVYPLKLYNVPTAIDAVETTGKVVDVKYYNMMGVESATPFNGVNIEVKTMDNGNRVASKKYF